MTTHDFHDESSLMRVSCGRDCIDSFNNSMQGGIGTDRHVSSTKIVVDGTNHSYYVQVAVFLLLFICDFTCIFLE